MKNIFTKIEFHYSFLIVALGLVITGHFANLFIFTSLIIVHEFGHVFMAVILGYKINKVIIYPYGGLTRLDCMINSSIYKDLLVAISGIVIQTIYFFIIHMLYADGIIREYIYNLFWIYHNSMLIFNLLPIIPLDGFRILNLILSKIFNFNLSNNLSVFVSLVSIIIILYGDFFDKNYSFILVLGILMKNIYKFYHDISYIYNRFLLERYLYNINYKSKKIINNENKMYKNKNHLLVKSGRIITERDFLNNFFYKKY